MQTLRRTQNILWLHTSVAFDALQQEKCRDHIMLDVDFLQGMVQPHPLGVMHMQAARMTFWPAASCHVTYRRQPRTRAAHMCARLMHLWLSAQPG